MSTATKIFFNIIAMLFIVGIVYKLGINIKYSYIGSFTFIMIIMVYHFEILTSNIKNREFGISSIYVLLIFICIFDLLKLSKFLILGLTIILIFTSIPFLTFIFKTHYKNLINRHKFQKIN